MDTKILTVGCEPGPSVSVSSASRSTPGSSASEERAMPTVEHSYVERLEAERDRLRAINAELLAALEGLVELCEHVPVFQLDGGRSSVKAVRRAGKFVGALDTARAAIAAAKETP
jgi:hypothetical protein